MKYLVKVTTVDDAKTYEVKYKTEATHKPRGGSYIFLETEDDLENPVVDIIEGELVLGEDPVKLIESLVTTKYHLMVRDIYEEMLVVFGTSNDVSASATAATWEAMVKRPVNYVSTDLGLADESAVTTYATAKLDEADAYGIFRLKRIAQYQAEKAAILTP